MKILGIDPGIGRTGWGVVQVQSAKCKVQSFGCIETSKSLPLEKRLEALYEQLQRVLHDEKPEEVAIEELFFNTNAKTALIVGQARGVVLLLAAKHSLTVTSYTPPQVKIAVAGFGQADKKQVEKMTMLQLSMKQKPKFDDTTDALAIALTHAFSLKIR